jgi:hypothetical protein
MSDKLDFDVYNYNKRYARVYNSLNSKVTDASHLLILSSVHWFLSCMFTIRDMDV